MPTTPDRILLSVPHMSGGELKYVQDAFDSNWLSTVGPNITAFECALEQRMGSPAAAVSSGTAAIHLALRLLGVGPGDQVLCPTLTFVATCNPIRYLGADPVFLDSEPRTWAIDPNLLEEALRTRAAGGRLPRAVIVVHLYGQCADMDPILDLCRRYQVPVLEDAAQALGATYKGHTAGTMGDIGIFSFNGNKIITTTGGGALLSRNSAWVEKARFWAQQARDPGLAYEHSALGYNYRMSNVLAGIGCGQLEVLNQRIEQRRAIAFRYRDALADLPGITLMPQSPNGLHTNWLSCFLINETEFGCSRDDLFAALDREQIESRPVWKPMHQQPLYRDCAHYGGNVAEDLFRRGICLPSSSSLSSADQQRVITAIRRATQIAPGRVSGTALKGHGFSSAAHNHEADTAPQAAESPASPAAETQASHAAENPSSPAEGTPASKAAEKLNPSQLCNKGTASAGPQMPDNNDSGFSPCALQGEVAPPNLSSSSCASSPEGLFSSTHAKPPRTSPASLNAPASTQYDPDAALPHSLIEDLLGRSPLRLTGSAISHSIHDRVVLVTGAAGSIGSELCTQIARFHPAALIALDIAESPLFELDLRLRRAFPAIPIHPEIANIQNSARLREILLRHKPSILYHAAAYKHVPLMETHVFDAIENNVLATCALARAATHHNVEHFVFISSDKAVRPSSVMGATKRIAEIALSAMHTPVTNFVSVRFGNVLESNGSVIPIFRKQIAAGGPVTVTHPDMRRFFMTNSEACQLVLQAAAIGQRGRIYVLDMGRQVSILDLARKMIRACGRTEQDIRIEFTGTRPGEKLSEELHGLLEHTMPTEHENIRVLSDSNTGQIDVQRSIDSLRDSCASRDLEGVVELLKETIEDYMPSPELLARIAQRPLDQPQPLPIR